jgi:hypothetical protein
MFNLRYHVASLAAVFLALTVGLILGTAIGDRSGLDKRQQQLLRSVQEEFESLRGENRSLARQLKAGQPLEGDSASRYARGRLEGKRVLVVSGTAGLPAGGSDLVTLLKQAGAEVQTVWMRRARLGLDDQAVRDRLLSVVASEPPEQMLASIETSLPGQLTRQGGGPIAKALQEAGVLAIEPPDLAGADAVVLVYSGAVDQGLADLVALARGLAERGIRVVATERTDATPSSIATFGDAGISTVDNIDRPSGRLSAILVLSGRGVIGHFGSKESATAPMPPLETPR